MTNSYKGKLILTDVDDVLLDWRNGMSQHILSYVDLHKTEIPERLLDHKFYVGDDDIAALGLPEAAKIDGFNYGHSFSALHAHLDAATVLPILYRMGYRFVAISAAGVGEALIQNRWKNLEAIFGPIFDDVIIVPRDATKKDILARYEPSIWVEDNSKNASDGADCGHRSFLLVDRRFPEKNDERVTQVKNWSEILKDIKEN